MTRAREALIFVHSVKLADVVGRINKQLITSRRLRSSLPSAEIASWLVKWFRELPDELSLIFSQTDDVERDIYLLYLPYLNAITLVYLYTSSARLPQASVASVLAAACTARILGDLVSTDRIGLVPEELGWYAATAALALMHVRPLPTLAPHARAHVNTLLVFLKRTGHIWHSSTVLEAGLRRSLGTVPQPSTTSSLAEQPTETTSSHTGPAEVPSKLEDLCAGDGVVWPDFFPFLSSSTSPLVDVILTECQTTFPQLWLSLDTFSTFADFVTGLDTWQMPLEGDVAA